MTDKNLDTELSKLRIAKGRKRPGRGRGRLVWALVLLVGAAGIGYFAYSRATAPVPVKVARAEKETLSADKGPALVTASGYVVPRHKIEVSAKIIARIKQSLVKRGDQVKEGDVLLVLDDEEYQAHVKSAKAQVESLRARVAELKAGSRPQEIEAANAGVASATATLKNAEREWKRLDALAKQKAISQQELDRARAAHDVARAQLDAQQKNAELVKIGPRKETVEAAEAQLREAEAGLQAAETELSYTVIRAPIGGTILEKLAEEGELVTNMNFGGTRGAKNSVVTMADLTDLQVEVDLNEADVAKVKQGQRTEIRLDSNPQHAYSGVVDEVSPQADRQKGTVQAKVRIADPDSTIKTEVNARVTFYGDPLPPGEQKGPRVWVPKPAVVRKGDTATVFVVEDDKGGSGRAVARPVKTGIDAEKGTEILDGLSGSETVILSPLEKMKDGQRVVVAG